jgi:outer membrane protein OmpA-like peptidoglycan-associated protein
MKKLILGCAFTTILLGGCASMPSEDTMNCYQPNRRVEVEVSGVQYKSTAKPKPGKRRRGKSVVLKSRAQGDSAWDFGQAELKDGGKKELDKMLKVIAKGTRRNKLPTTVGSIGIAGHTDRFEAESGPANLGDMRARAVAKYLASKGLDSKLMFWEDKGAKKPVPVTKFCKA